jgi:uncharacterized protein
MKIVFDTNVLISALITTGKPKELFSKAVSGQIELVLSKNILKEFSEISSDLRIRKYANQDDIIAFLRVIDRVAKIVKVESRVKAVKEDPDDDMVLRTALDGKADFIVSRDKHLLSLKELRGIKILAVDEMLTLINKKNA